MNNKAFVLLESIITIFAVSLIITLMSVISNQYMPEVISDKEYLEETFIKNNSFKNGCDKECLIKKVLWQ
ncbi:hypothetical protein [Mycoplasma sp. P36-A1]|uniref:hypothetical protein n=1 Tax=Mycoplasma sp. P36-A1 TaxID=3252900 RepID=UPI003C2C15D5